MTTLQFSEKSQILGDTLGVQVFKVDTNATKKEIKKAVELMFEVTNTSKDHRQSEFVCSGDYFGIAY